MKSLSQFSCCWLPDSEYCFRYPLVLPDPAQQSSHSPLPSSSAPESWGQLTVWSSPSVWWQSAVIMRWWYIDGLWIHSCCCLPDMSIHLSWRHSELHCVCVSLCKLSFTHIVFAHLKKVQNFVKLTSVSVSQCMCVWVWMWFAVNFSLAVNSVVVCFRCAIPLLCVCVNIFRTLLMNVLKVPSWI